MADILERMVNRAVMNCEHGNCRSCCDGICSGICSRVVLSQQEIDLLFRFSLVPFLPVAMGDSTSQPVYSDDDLNFSPSCGKAVLGLAQKGLISLDFDLPLTNYDYTGYEQYPQKGSMALTAKGQDVLDLMEYQGIKA